MMMGVMKELQARGSELLGGGRETVLRVEPDGAARGGAVVPARLVSPERVSASDAMRRRRFVMTMGMGMGGMMGDGMGMHGVNGRAFAMERVDEEVRLGDVEVWEVSGEMMVHPFHVHGVHFDWY